MRYVVLSLWIAAYGVAAHASEEFILNSPDFTRQGELKDEHSFNGFGCTGRNLSPALEWSGPPVGTRSFALLVHDPDAPTGGSGWWHWVVVNLPATARQLPAGAGRADGGGLPPGAEQVRTDFGIAGWGGPCPPAGDAPHRYGFTLHALKVEKIDLPAGATAALAGYLVNANSLGNATLTGTYGR